MHTRHMSLAVLLMLVIAACERGAPTQPSSIASSELSGEPRRQQVNVETTTEATRQPPSQDSPERLGTSM